MAGSWPNSQDYNEAVQNPGFSFSDPELQRAEAVTNTLGIPQAFSGGFADVYRFRAAGSRSWAVKCFTKRVESRRERYAAISQHLQQASLSFTVGFEFVEQGIRIQGDWYPVLKMDWVEGHTLANFVRDNLSKPKLLKALLNIWLKVEPRLHRAQMAHGDLQHGNVMLIPGRTEDKLSLKLIDYDGIWIGPLNEQPSGEVGHPSYQHPERLQRGTYSVDVDRFPHFVIAAALRCLADPSGAQLWETYDTGENLLFSQSDFAKPGESPLLHELWERGHRGLQAWVGHLVRASQSPLEATPRLSTLAPDAKITALSADDEDAVRQFLGLSSGQLRVPDPSDLEPADSGVDRETAGATSDLSASLPPHADNLATDAESSPDEVESADWSTEESYAYEPETDDDSDFASVEEDVYYERRRKRRSRGKPPKRRKSTVPRLQRYLAGVFLAIGGLLCLWGVATWATSSMNAPDGTTSAEVAVSASARTVVSRSLPASGNSGDEWSGNSLGMKLMWCPPGSFTMGSPSTEAGRQMGEDQVDGTLTQGFWMGKYEVTQKEWQSVMQTTPWEVQRDTLKSDDCPATVVSWDDTVKFCEKLTASERAASRLPPDWEYTLPTEAQWEYGCRAGTSTRFSFGDDEGQLSDHDWFYANAGSVGERFAHQVGQKQGNAWGLHDMHGNVTEWCIDWHSDRRPGGTDPRGPSSGLYRIVRGGGVTSPVEACRSASQLAYKPGGYSGTRGFRVVAVPPVNQSPVEWVSPKSTGPLKEGELASEERDDNGLNLKLVWCEPGSFTMGSPPDEPGRESNEDQVEVTLTRGFWLGKYEVTQSQWQTVMQTTPWKGEVDVREESDCPATYVNWDDAVEFCGKLTAFERAAERLAANWEYTLPTEAQWEYACRAGTTTRFSFGDDETQLGNFAWFEGNAFDAREHYAHQVGQKRANAWGLHDMHGNVLEWCRDSYRRRLSGGTDPIGADTASGRVYRGGNWRLASGVRILRSAHRRLSTRGERNDHLGFRVAAVPLKAIGIDPAPPLSSTTNAAPLPAVSPTRLGVGTRTGEMREDNSLKMKLVWCLPGQFTMGSPASEVDREDNEDQVPVTLTQGFWLGKYEVTQREWRDVMDSEPWNGQKYVKEGDQIAATWLSWDDAVAFCGKLTASERESGRLPNDWEYTLPTEAQWEYACRAGTTTAYSFGNSASELGQYAWWGGLVRDGNAKNEQYAHAVGLKRPNAWSLHDMHGNVWEWCRDYYAAIVPGGTDPRGPSSGSLRAYRGGSWLNSSLHARSAYRYRYSPGYRVNNLGFRVLRSSVLSGE